MWAPAPENEDIVVNVCKKKHVTNTRAAGSDEALKLTPPTSLSLEQSLEFIADDELVEVTPKSIRMRKQILSKELRMKQASKKEIVRARTEQVAGRAHWRAGSNRDVRSRARRGRLLRERNRKGPSEANGADALSPLDEARRFAAGLACRLGRS